MYIYVYTHTHTHIYIYIYIQLYAVTSQLYNQLIKQQCAKKYYINRAKCAKIIKNSQLANYTKLIQINSHSYSQHIATLHVHFLKLTSYIVIKPISYIGIAIIDKIYSYLLKSPHAMFACLGSQLLTSTTDIAFPIQYSK